MSSNLRYIFSIQQPRELILKCKYGFLSHTNRFRFGDNEGGRGRPGRRLMGRLGGVQRFANFSVFVPQNPSFTLAS